MPRHAHTLSCLLFGFCSLPKLCFHGNIRIFPCWNILNIVYSCMNQSDIADALIALISGKALSARLPHSILPPWYYFYFGVLLLLKTCSACSQNMLLPLILLSKTSKDRRKFSFCKPSCCTGRSEVRVDIRCLTEGLLGKKGCPCTRALPWKSLFLLPTQSPTTNQGKSKLNTENERQINNHRCTELHLRGSYFDFKVGVGSAQIR